MKISLKLKSLVLAIIMLCTRNNYAAYPIPDPQALYKVGEAVVEGATVAGTVATVVHGRKAIAKAGKALAKKGTDVQRGLEAAEIADQAGRTSHHASHPTGGIGYDSGHPLDTARTVTFDGFDGYATTDNIIADNNRVVGIASTPREERAAVRSARKEKTESVTPAKSTATSSVAMPVATRTDSSSVTETDPSTSKPIKQSLDHILQDIRDTSSEPRIIKDQLQGPSHAHLETSQTIGADEWLMREYNEKAIKKYSKYSADDWMKCLRKEWPAFRGDFKNSFIDEDNFQDFVFHNFRRYQFPEFLKLLETFGESFDNFLLSLQSDANLRKKMRVFTSIGGYKNKEHYRHLPLRSHRDTWAFEEWLKAKNEKSRSRKKSQAPAITSTTGTPPPNKKPKKKNKNNNQTLTVDKEWTKDPTSQKNRHIHDNKDHLWDQTGLTTDQINKKIIEAFEKAISEGIVPQSGRFEIHPTINGHPVTIRGFVVNGMVKTGTAFVVNPTQLAMAVWQAAQATGKIILGLGATAMLGEASAATPDERGKGAGAPRAGHASATDETPKEPEAVGTGMSSGSASSRDGKKTARSAKAAKSKSGKKEKSGFGDDDKEGKKAKSSGATSGDGKIAVTLKVGEAEISAGVEAPKKPEVVDKGSLASLASLSSRDRKSARSARASTRVSSKRDPSPVDDDGDEPVRPSGAMSGGDGSRVVDPSKPRLYAKRDSYGFTTYEPSESYKKKQRERMHRAEQERLYDHARKICRVPRSEWTKEELAFGEQHQEIVDRAVRDIFAEVRSAMNKREIDRTSEEDNLLDTYPHFVEDAKKLAAKRHHKAMQTRESASQPSDDDEEYDEDEIAAEIERIQKLLSYERTEKEKQFLIDHQDVVQKLKKEKERQEQREQEAAIARMREQMILRNLEKIHRIPTSKRAVEDQAFYDHYLPLTFSYRVKMFDETLKKDIKQALKKAVSKRKKDDKELINDHPDIVKQIQDEQEAEREKKRKEEEKELREQKREAAKREKQWQKLEKQYARARENPDQAAYLARIGKRLDDRVNNPDDEDNTDICKKRRDAIEQTLDKPRASNENDYTIEHIPSAYQDLVGRFIDFTGSPVQEQVHDELVDTIRENNRLYRAHYQTALPINENRHVANISACVYHFADIARQYNEAGKIEQAFAVADFCSDLLALENRYVDFVTKHQNCVKAGLFSMLPFSGEVDPLVEFGKKLHGFVEKYDTKEISPAFEWAATSLSKALALTSNDPAIFAKKIKNQGAKGIKAVDAGKEGAEQALITFVAQRFLHGSALGLKASDDTKAVVAALVEAINDEKTIAAQAGESEESKQLLSPIKTIFKEAVEEAIKKIKRVDAQEKREAAQAKAELKKAEARTRRMKAKRAAILAAAATATSAEDDDKEAKDPKSGDEDDGKKPVDRKKSSDDQGTKRTRAGGAKATETVPEDPTGLAPVDEREDGQEAHDVDEDESIAGRLKKRRQAKPDTKDEKEKKEAEEEKKAAKAVVVKDPRLKSCLQQNNPQLKKYNQDHGLHCGYYALAHAWRWLQNRPTGGTETRLWLRDKLRSSIRPGSWEDIVHQRRFQGAAWNRDAYPGSVNNLTSEDLELIVRHELKNYICSQEFKEVLRGARIALEIDEKDAMALAQVARNGFADVDAGVQTRLNAVLGTNKNFVYNQLRQHALCNILIIDSMTQLRDIYFGQGLTPLLSASVDLYRDFKIPQSMVINIGADRGDASATTHWIAWSRDEKGAHALFDSLYSTPTLSVKHEQCCRLIDMLFGQTSVRLNHKAEVITRLQTARAISLQAEPMSQQYRDNLLSFLETLVRECLRNGDVAAAVDTEINDAKVAIADDDDVKLSAFAQACVMTVQQRTAGDLAYVVTLDPATLLRTISAAYPVACRNVEATGRTWDVAALRERAQARYNDAHTYALANLGEGDYQEIVDFLGYRDFAAAMVKKPLFKAPVRSSARLSGRVR